MAYVTITDATLTGKKAFTQATLRQFRDNDEYLKGRADLTNFYDFIDASDVLITTTVPTGTLWSSSQSIIIPTSGLLVIIPYLRVDNAAGGNRQYYMGLRINGTDYWAQIDDNGTPVYLSFSGTVTTAEYYTTKGSGGIGGSIPTLIGFDVEGFGISTGNQTAQPIIASNATGSQTLKGVTVTARLAVTILDRS